MFTTSDHYSNSMAAIIRPPQLMMERGGAAAKWKFSNGSNEIAPNCPRCASSNTKFCYYNNYSLSQPRYFCKGCRRYWTKGGSLRNVPVGGGCRKSRRARAARHPSSASASAPFPDPSPDALGGGACIDMAAVFAKYVNQDADNEEESFSPGDSSGSSENIQTSAFDGEDAVTAFEHRDPLDSFSAGDDQAAMMMSTCRGGIGQEFLFADSSGFALPLHQQGVLSEDILWEEGTTLLHFPMVQVEDCGLFTPDDDQLRIPASLVSDNWASFDLSSYDFYSHL